MEKFSKLNGQPGSRLSVDISLPLYLQDHHFMGKAVYPAVEAMQTLANTVKRIHPDIDATRLRDVRFNKFLPIPPDKSALAVFVDITAHDAGTLSAALKTRKYLKTSTMTRLLTHATASFSFGSKNDDGLRVPRDMAEGPANGEHTISAGRIYEELVPFGPAYQNLIDNLIISPAGAVARIKAPTIASQGLLGSPFPLDAAFQAACVWGQHYAGYVPFPVEIGNREVVIPTIEGEAYIARIIPAQVTPDRLTVDIWLYDGKGDLRETATSVEMRDVSNGQLKPPDWICQTGSVKKG